MKGARKKCDPKTILTGASRVLDALGGRRIDKVKTLKSSGTENTTKTVER
jgi:hypothetical protein